MERKTFTHSDIEIIFEDFYKKYTECKNCNRVRSLKRFYENKERLSNQRRMHYDKNREELLQKQNIRPINKKEFLRSYSELQIT